MASKADQLASNINFSKFGKADDLKKRIWFTIGALIVFERDALLDVFRDVVDAVAEAKTPFRVPYRD